MKKIVEIKGTEVQDPDYPSCKCGRSARWYPGQTDMLDNKEVFTCQFCAAGVEEGSDLALAMFGSNRYKFYKVVE